MGKIKQILRKLINLIKRKGKRNNMPVSTNDLDLNVLTYLQALRKIVDKVNEIIEEVNSLNGLATDITNKLEITQVLINEVTGNDGSLYNYAISCNCDLEEPSRYVIYLYNDSQGLLLPLLNKLDNGGTLEFTCNEDFGTESEFWDDCMFLAKRLI